MKLHNPFNRLAWKLTLTYTLVTVATLMVLELLILGTILYVAYDMVPTMTVSAMLNGVPKAAAPYLEASPPDVDGLNRWMRSTADNGVVAGVSDSSDGTDGINVKMTPLTQLGDHFFVFDANDRLLAEYHKNGEDVSDQAAKAKVDQYVTRALAGENERDKLSSTTDSSIVVAAPIRSGAGQVIGAVAMIAPKPGPAKPFESIAPVVITSLVFFTLGAGAIGTIFGFFTARGLTRRLRTMAKTATQWGQGQFVNKIPDKSPDELGQLASRLNAMSAELESLVQTRQQVATLDERNRLARDLHDSVKQQVFAISMNLGAVQAVWDRDPQEARKRLDAAATLARDTQKELASLIQTLRPVQLEEKGLTQALRDYAKGWESQTGIAAVCQIQEIGPLAVDTEQALFRIAQEALANVARHSGAKAVSLSLIREPAAIVLKVIDNGHGFVVQQHGGMGLRSMQERVETLGGSLLVESNPQGTHLEATIPLAQDEGVQR